MVIRILGLRHGVRAVRRRRDRSERKAVVVGALARRASPDTGSGTFGAFGDRGASACTQFCDRGDDARFFAPGLVNGDVAIAGEEWTVNIDALAVRSGSGKFVRLERTAVKFPPTDFNRIGAAFTSLCGTVLRVEIERATGALRITQADSVFEGGEAPAPMRDLVENVAVMEAGNESIKRNGEWVDIEAIS